MCEEPIPPDPLALTRALTATGADVETTMSFYAPDAVWDGSPLGFEIYEGHEAIRQSLEEWTEIFEGHEEVDLEMLDLGNGVVFTATRLSGHQRSASGADRIQGLYGYVIVWTKDKISRMTVYPDIDEARAAAERLAEERG
jgi:ketosteroid isomerase-like protein